MIALLLALAVIAPEAADAFDRVVAALSTGYHGHPRRAAQTLSDTGAHPLDGGNDLAQRWAHGAVTYAPYRDRALGPGYRRIAVGAGTTAHFTQVFLAGQRARVALVPVKAATVRLQVSDDDGTAQCRGPATDRCDWVPLWTTRFRIDIDNRGQVAGDYYLVVE